MDVKIKDRKEEIEYVRMGLNMCEMGVDYPSAELILRVIDRVEKLKGKFSCLDAVDIHHKWKDEWMAYFEANEK